MLTLEQCREYLGEDFKDLSDQEIEDIKNTLYQLANVLVDGFIKNKEAKNGNNKTDGS
ncbi:hypothetical protein HY605_02665 [Candidatus Peregrinibacteria bacterium]|nr:hypothetical protein [Candidatus Peregrinibacteria bacterium]